MKRIICLTLCALMLFSLFTACKENNEPLKAPPEVGFLVAAQFTDYLLGTVPELVPESVITEKIISPEIVEFKSYEKGLSALRDGKLHGLVLADDGGGNILLEGIDDSAKVKHEFLLYSQKQS